jgi:hypothetical protein
MTRGAGDARDVAAAVRGRLSRDGRALHRPVTLAASRDARAAGRRARAGARAGRADGRAAVAALVHVGRAAGADGRVRRRGARHARRASARCRSPCATTRAARSSAAPAFSTSTRAAAAGDRPHLVRGGVQRTRAQHRVQAAAADPRVRDAALHRRRVPHALVQPRSRGRRSRGWVRSRTACCAITSSCPTARCATPSCSQHHRRRVAGGAAAPRAPAARAATNTRAAPDPPGDRPPMLIDFFLHLKAPGCRCRRASS